MITDDISLIEAVKSEDYVDIDNIYGLIPIDVRLHMQRVNSGCRLLAELMLENDVEEEDELAMVVTYSDRIFRYHDIGYGFLPIKTYCNSKADNSVLDMKKFFELDNSDEGMFASHVELGNDAYEIPLFLYRDSNVDKLSIDVSMYHHEKWDGTGFPEGLKGKDIPLVARICAVMDMYDMFAEFYPCTKENKNKYVIDALSQVSGEFLQPEIVDIVKENADVFFEHDMECGNVNMF